MPYTNRVMIIRARTLLLLAVALAMAGCAMSNEVQAPQENTWQQRVVDESHPIELDASALHLGAVALGAFKARNKHWRCFEVAMYSQDTNWRVDFVPTDDVQDAGDTLVVGVSKCGNGVSYLLNPAGDIVQVIHAR